MNAIFCLFTYECVNVFLRVLACELRAMEGGKKEEETVVKGRRKRGRQRGKRTAPEP